MRSVILFLCFYTLVLGIGCSEKRYWVTTDELENHISPEDLWGFVKLHQNASAATTEAPGLDNKYGGAPDYWYPTLDPLAGPEVPQSVDCFGLGAITRQLPWLFNMQPDSAENVNTHFYFSSRKQPDRVQVLPGDQFGLEWVDFKPTRRTVLIAHGFMSHSNATWVLDMTRAFLEFDDVNVITVDWSGGGDTWKYWRAVANTRRVGSDVTGFMNQLMATTGAKAKDFHFVGHSLGAHIVSYVSFHIGRVHRITGLDPAQPCFRTANTTERLDESDADFVDVIHTNGRLLKKIGFGLPDVTGHADFYPNGGMKQPGCHNMNKTSIWSRILPSFLSPISLQLIEKFYSSVLESTAMFCLELQQAICSHGRAYLLFTESLINSNCSFRAHRWNLTYEGVNASLVAACERKGCSEMGIRAVGGKHTARARGPYFVLTTEKQPYCPSDWERSHPKPDLLNDLKMGFQIDNNATNVNTTTLPPYADPMILGATVEPLTTTTTKSWFRKFFG